MTAVYFVISFINKTQGKKIIKVNKINVKRPKVNLKNSHEVGKRLLDSLGVILKFESKS